VKDVDVGRFNDSYEAVWSVSDVNDTWSYLLSTSTCDADTSHVDKVERLLQQLLDVTHADTTRYHVTDSAAVTSSSDDERHGDVTPEVESAAAAVWLDEYWRHAWTLFITLDLLLVVARATVTYVNAAEIYRGSRRTQRQSYHQPTVSAVNHCVANGQAGGSAACSRLKAKTADQADRQSTWSWVVDSIGSRSLLVIVHLSSLVALLYLAARVATSSAAVDVIVHVIYDVYRQRVRVHLAMSDALAREQAKLITSALTQSPQQLDLIALHVLDQYFRLGR